MASGDNCRTGCNTKDHESWGECARASHLLVGWAASAGYRNMDLTAEKKWDKELELYKSARRQGIQPEGTTTDKVEKALKISEFTGKAYNAEVNPPSNFLTQKRVVKAAIEAGVL